MAAGETQLSILGAIGSKSEIVRRPYDVLIYAVRRTICESKASLGLYTLNNALNTVLFLLEQRSCSQHQQRTLYMCRCER